MLIAAGFPLRADDAQKLSARAVIDKYCITCHNAKLKTAGLQLDTADVDHSVEHADLWEKVARKLRTGEMPPAGLAATRQSHLCTHSHGFGERA